MTRYIFYGRVSTIEQSQEGFSLEAQELACRDYIKRKGDGCLVGLYRDAGFSGSLPVRKRPQLKKLFIDLEINKDTKVLLVWRLDRIFRNLRNLLELEHDLTNKGVALVSIMEQVDGSTASGRAFLNMVGVLAEFEASAAAERTLATMLSKVSQIHLGGKPPIGFKIINGKLQVDPVTAPIVQIIFRQFLKNNNLTKIAEYLNKRNFVTSYGKKFSQKKVIRILQNGAYAGHTIWNKRNARLGRLKPIEKWVVKKNTHEPIISERIFNQAKKILGNGHIKTYMSDDNVMKRSENCLDKKSSVTNFLKVDSLRFKSGQVKSP